MLPTDWYKKGHINQHVAYLARNTKKCGHKYIGGREIGRPFFETNLTGCSIQSQRTEQEFMLQRHESSCFQKLIYRTPQNQCMRKLKVKTGKLIFGLSRI